MDADLPRPGESTAPGDAARRIAERLQATREWLVAELRDECSDSGVRARGYDLSGVVGGVRTFVREARRLGAPAERMLVLLKQCLADERLPRDDRELYQQYYESAISTAIATYYEATDGPADGPGGR